METFLAKPSAALCCRSYFIRHVLRYAAEISARWQQSMPETSTPALKSIA